MKYKTFADIKQITAKPLKKRQLLAIGRGGKKVLPRGYSLDPADIVVYKEQFKNGDKVPNPFNKGSQYYILEAMKSLGVNKNHSWARFMEEFVKLAGSADTKKDGKTYLQTFKAKPSRNEETGLDWKGKVEQTFKVMQRLGGFHPYGQKLLDIGTEVLGTKGVALQILKGSTGEVMVRLATDSNEPSNAFKHVKGEKVETKATGKKRGRKPKATLIETPVTAEVPGPETAVVMGENTVDNGATDVTIAEQQPTVTTEVTPVVATPVELNKVDNVTADAVVGTVTNEKSADVVEQTSTSNAENVTETSAA